MTMTLAVEWARPYNIKINSVAAGHVKSSGTDQYNVQLMENSKNCKFEFGKFQRVKISPNTMKFSHSPWKIGNRRRYC